MTGIRATVPAKALLLGEFAVLEGWPALAITLDRRIGVVLEPFEVDGVLLESPIWPRPWTLGWTDLALGALQPEALRLVLPLLRRWADAARGDAPGLRLRFDEGFPVRWGLGSSSASTLALAAVLQAAAGEGVAGARDLFVAAREAQRGAQGLASGYDVATQMVGGLVSFRGMGDDAAWARQPIEGVRGHILVAWTGTKVSTAEMVRAARATHPPGDPLYARMGAVAEEALRILPSGDLERLGALLRQGQVLLEDLGCVPPELRAILRAMAGDPDILGAKLSGAGGGDCVIVLADDPAGAAATCEHHGLQVLPLSPTEDGLDVETLSVGEEPSR